MKNETEENKPPFNQLDYIKEYNLKNYYSYKLFIRRDDPLFLKLKEFIAENPKKLTPLIIDFLKDYFELNPPAR